MALAAKLALGMDDPLAKVLENTIIEASRKALDKDSDSSSPLKQFDHLCRTGGGDPLLPFQISAVDQAVAKLHYRHYLEHLDHDADTKPGLKIYTDWSSGDAGYAHLHCSGVEYEASHRNRGERTDHSVVLKPFFMQEIVTRLAGLPSAPLVNACEADDGVMISLDLESTVARYRPTNEKRCNIILIDPEAPKANSGTSIRGVKVDLTPLQMRVTINEPEAIMQVTAAHFRGFWMAIRSGEFQTAFRIPDLSGSGESQSALFALSHSLLSPYFTQTKPIALTIDSETGIGLSQRLWWFATDNLAEMIVEIMKASLGTRSA